jgi:hypothetical protein
VFEAGLRPSIRDRFADVPDLDIVIYPNYRKADARGAAGRSACR